MSIKFGVIGSSAVDIFAISKFFKPQKNSLEPHILLNHNSQIWLDNVLQEPGGNGLLAAITIARQQNKVELYTKLGSDLAGKALVSIAKEEKVSLIGDYCSAKHHTDTTLHISSNGKNQTKLIYNESFSDFSKKSVSKLSSNIDILHVANIANDKSTLNNILRWCKSNNTKLSANFQYLNKFSSRYIVKYFKASDIVVINHDEACLLVGGFCSSMNAAQKLSDIGLKHFVIFGDKAESVAYYDNKLYSANLKIRSNSLEYTGVEAVFAASYVEEFYKSNDINKALARAVTQASSVMTISGARAGILYSPIRKTVAVKTYSLDQMKGALNEL